MISEASPAPRPHTHHLARGGWLLLCAVLLVAFVACQVVLYGALLEPCLTDCRGFYLTAGEIAGLRAQGLGVELYAAGQVGLYVVFCLVNLALGGLLFWRGADDPWTRFVGLMLTLVGLTFTEVPDALWQQVPAAAALLQLGSVLAGVSFYAFCFSFPNGRFVPSWLRWAAAGVALMPVVRELLDTLLMRPDLADALQPLTFGAFVLTTLVTQTLRYLFGSTPAERQQTRWVLLGIIVALAWVSLVGSAQALIPGLGRGALHKLLFTTLIYAGFLLVPLSIGVAVLRSGLWDIDILISRALVFSALTVCVIGLYALIVGYLGALFRVEGSPIMSIAATGVIALLFEPLRLWLQRSVNRLVYGDRDDPYVALARLGRRLEETMAAETALPIVVETLAQTLRLPYAAIALCDQGGELSPVPVAAHGALPSDKAVLERVGLSYQGEMVGQLLVAPRPGERTLGSSDRRLLGDLARQAGAAAHAVRLAADLRRSRGEVVAAREEERRRLRRDLHDGLGPVLATLVVQVEAARELLSEDPGAADDMLASVTTQAQGAITDVRNLVYALRPPALDDLGLVGALRAHAARHALGRLEVRVDAPEPMPLLPAAVEVAAYRIVQEALTNVLRHSEARRCSVTLDVVGLPSARVLAVEVRDDGVGLPPGREHGVGLRAMQERAAEVGGTCQVGQAGGGGTQVSAYLPL